MAITTTPNGGYTKADDGDDGYGAGLRETIDRLDIEVSRQWAQRRSTTAGFVFGWYGGVALNTGAPVLVASGTVTLGASATWYVERTEAGVVSANTSGFTAGRLPMAVVTTDSSGITSVVDWRPAFTLAPVTGWNPPTGTQTRGTFDAATATVASVAQTLAALIADLRSRGVLRS